MGELIYNPDLLRVPVYIAGKSPDDVQKEIGLNDIVKLGSNENPLGPSPKAVAAMRQALLNSNRYPGNIASTLRKKLAGKLGYGLTEDSFLIGNGATDLLRLVTHAFLLSGGETIMGSVTFPLCALNTHVWW